MTAPTHSIIIPHRDRNLHLAACIDRLHQAFAHCHVGHEAWEVVVVDSGSSIPPATGAAAVRLVRDEKSPPVFCKGRAQNLGIEAARGDVLTFLDADSLVGLDWPRGAIALLARPDLTRLCYRVRYLPEGANLADLEAHFADYDSHALAFEAYRNPGRNRAPDKEDDAVFGNSQFSIARQNLGGLRFDERYIGRGFEDLEFTWRIWFAYGKRYRGQIITAGHSAMFHQLHPYRAADWYDRDLRHANRNRYVKELRDAPRTT